MKIDSTNYFVSSAFRKEVTAHVGRDRDRAPLKYKYLNIRRYTMSYDVMFVKFVKNPVEDKNMVVGLASSCPPSYISVEDKPNANSAERWAEPDAVVIGWETEPVIYEIFSDRIWYMDPEGGISWEVDKYWAEEAGYVAAAAKLKELYSRDTPPTLGEVASACKLW